MTRLRIKTPRESRIDKLIRVGVTRDSNDFLWACRNLSNRVNIIAEGDSWFAYPSKFLIGGPRANIIDHVAYTISRSRTANLLRLASNGDEAVEMMSGRQKQEMAELLHTGGQAINLILFSGGGNDVAGKWDMERLLVPYEPGFSASDCIHARRFERKMTQVIHAYEELIDLRDEYAPNAQVVTHTYDIVKPDNKSAEFIAGLVAKGPWIQPYMEEKNIPEELQLPIVEIMLGELESRLTGLSEKSEYRGVFFAVRTQGTLRPGHGSDWKDEMHPTPSGFGRIAEKYYEKIRALHPDLPGFKRLPKD